MLTCKEVTERSSALIDGELGLWDRLQLRLHLAMCEGCRRFARQMRVTNELAMSAASPRDGEAAEQDQIDVILSRLPQYRQQDR